MPTEVGVSQLGQGTTSAAITRTVASGSGLVACGWADSGGAITAGNLTDNRGNTWTLLGTSTQSFAAVISLWVCAEAASGSTTITLTPDNPSDKCAVEVSEFTAADSSTPVDAFALLFDTGLTNTPSPGSLTTTSDNDLVFGYLFQNYENVTYTPGSGFAIDFGSTGEFSCEVATVGAAGTYPVSWTTSDNIPPAVAAVAIRAPLPVQPPTVVNLNCTGFGLSPLDTGAVAINSTSWAQVGLVTLGGGKRSALLTLLTGSGGALGHLKLSRADAIGGRHVDWLVDTDFNTATDELQDCIVPGISPANIYQLAASGVGQIKLAKCRAVGEIGIWAKAASANTTLRVTGNFMSSK